MFFEVCDPRNYARYSCWSQKPEISGAWTLLPSRLAFKGLSLNHLYPGRIWLELCSLQIAQSRSYSYILRPKAGIICTNTSTRILCMKSLDDNPATSVLELPALSLLVAVLLVTFAVAGVVRQLTDLLKGPAPRARQP